MIAKVAVSKEQFKIEQSIICIYLICKLSDKAFFDFKIIETKKN